MTAAVEFQGVTRHFGAVKAVDGVDLAIAEGSFFAMLGPSGSGKTTCLRLISGFEKPGSGTLRIFGEDCSAVPPNRRNVNTVFQDYALFPHMSVRDNVAYGLMVKGVARALRHDRAEAMLSLVKLDGYGGRKPAQLSGGQRQRVALARALVNEPRVLLLDEPLGALDLKLREAMQDELKALQQRLGITFVFVTHDQGEALSMADRVAVFSEGRVAQVGTPQEVYERPATRFVADFVGSSNVLPPEITRRFGGPDRWASLRPEAVEMVAAQTGAPDAPGALMQAALTKIAPGGVTRGPAAAAAAGKGAPGAVLQAGPGVLAGRVTGLRYLGAGTRITVDVGGHPLAAMLRPGQAVPAVGAQVGLRFAPAALHLMDSA